MDRANAMGGTHLSPANGHASHALLFSLEDGFVFASWPGASGSVRLGTYEDVREMMRDFLAQSEVGDRLSGERRGA